MNQNHKIIISAIILIASLLLMHYVLVRSKADKNTYNAAMGWIILVNLASVIFIL